VLAGLFALVWLLPGFGLIDLTVTWSSEWPEVLEAGWGLFFTLLVAAPFVVVASRRCVSMAVPVMLYVATTALVVSAAAALEPGCLALAALLAVETVVVTGRPRRWSGWGVPRTRTAAVLAAIAGLGAVPWLVYALNMWSLNRQDRFDSDVTNDVDHYSVQGALAVSLATLALLAVVIPLGRRLIGVCAGLAAAYLGLVSLAWHPTAGSFDTAWSVLCITWAVGLAAFCWPRGSIKSDPGEHVHDEVDRPDTTQPSALG